MSATIAVNFAKKLSEFKYHFNPVSYQPNVGCFVNQNPTFFKCFRPKERCRIKRCKFTNCKTLQINLVLEFVVTYQTFKR